MTRKKKALAATVPLNFLLTCSQMTLDNFELTKLASIANLRSELHAVLDRLIDEMAHAGIARWFRAQDREQIKRALDNPADVLAIAKEKIRDGQRSEEEELIPLSLLPPGSAHIAASLRYQERNIAEGLCAVCPKPLARNSVRYCEKHLTMARLRMTPSKGKPGSIGYLYGDTEDRTHGRQPGTLKALAEANKKRAEQARAEIGAAKPAKRLKAGKR